MPVKKLPPRAEKRAIDSSLAIVNIVLLLIFFFLTTGSLLNSDSVEIALPETTELPLDKIPQPLLVVDAEGAMFLDGDPIASGALASALIDSPRVHVLADRDLSALALLDTLDKEKLIAVDIRLVTLHRTEEASP